MKQKNITSVILAAGEGTRMKSDVPKVLHSLCGKTLLSYPLSLVRVFSKNSKTLVVVGHKSKAVRKAFSSDSKVCFVEQKKQLGTADAFRSAFPSIPAATQIVLILCGDTPLLSKETIRALIRRHEKQKNTATILSAHVHNPFGYGRIKRAKDESVIGIIEEKDALSEEKDIQEVNSGVYCFDFKALKKNITHVKANNAKKEFYLTDVIQILKAKGHKIDAYATHDPSEILGINTQADLATAHAIKYHHNAMKLMDAGVAIMDPYTVYVDDNVRIGKDSVLLPGCILSGNVSIGKGCRIGPYTSIQNSKIGDNTAIEWSHVAEAQIGNNVNIGPFARIRKGTKMKNGCKVGNFTETKNAFFDIGSKASHLSYLGDVNMGKHVNVGAGTITCNYDGSKKHKTVIHDKVFIGSNTNLVAPVSIGKGALIAAGSTVCNDVPSGALAIARSRQTNKKNRARKK